MRIRPAKRLRGRVSVPGDKSISHRAAIIAALARGPTRISNFSSSADCAATLRCLAQLGVGVERESEAVIIEGVGCGQPGRWAFSEPSQPLDCGNSGTTMRLVAGVLAAQPFAATLTGDASLQSRPMRRVIEPLELMGARVSSAEGHAPLRVEGRPPLDAIEYQLPLASAQVKSCVLLAGLSAEGFTEVRDVAGTETRDHTERMLDWFGVPVERRLVMRGDATLDTYTSVGLRGPVAFDTPGEVTVPGDVSAASFIAATAAILSGSLVSFEEVCLNTARAEFLHTLKRLGADVEFTDSRLRCQEPVGRVSVGGIAGGRVLAPPPEEGGRLSLGGAAVARMIDELPLLAVVGTRVVGGIEVRDAAELRVKESDRIRATVENLRAMGAEAEEYEDGFRVEGSVRLRGARLDSFGDHRIAMAFTVAALIAEGESEIEGAEDCVGVSFPGFFPLLATLVER